MTEEKSSSALYNYLPGPTDQIRRDALFEILPVLSRYIKYKVIGDMALYLLNELFDGSGPGYRFLHTQTECQTTKKRLDHYRSLDLVVHSPRSKSTILSVLKKQFGVIAEVQSTTGNSTDTLLFSNGFISRINCQLILNPLSTPDYSYGYDISARSLRRDYGEIAIPITITYMLPSYLNRIECARLSQTFWVEYSMETHNFIYGQIGRLEPRDYTKRNSLENIIHSARIAEQLYGNVDLPFHSRAGDPIMFHDYQQCAQFRQRLFLDDDPLKKGLYRRIMFVLSGQDLCLLNFLNMPTILVADVARILDRYDDADPTRIQSDLRSGVCTICADSFEDWQQIHLTNCAHIFHTGCLASYLRRYYTHVLDTANETNNVVSITEHDINGNIIRSDSEACCPNCLRETFRITIPQEMDQGHHLIELPDLDQVPFR